MYVDSSRVTELRKRKEKGISTYSDYWNLWGCSNVLGKLSQHFCPPATVLIPDAGQGLRSKKGTVTLFIPWAKEPEFYLLSNGKPAKTSEGGRGSLACALVQRKMTLKY